MVYFTFFIFYYVLYSRAAIAAPAPARVVPTPVRVANIPDIPSDVIVAKALPDVTAPIELWVAAAMLPAKTPAVPKPIAMGIRPAAAIAPPPIITIALIPIGILYG